MGDTDFLKGALGAPDNLRSFNYYSQLNAIENARKKTYTATTSPTKKSSSTPTYDFGGFSSSASSGSGGGEISAGGAAGVGVMVIFFAVMSIVTSSGFQNGVRAVIHFLIYTGPWICAYSGAYYLLLNTYLLRRTRNMTTLKLGLGLRLTLAILLLGVGAIFFSTSSPTAPLLWLGPASVAVFLTNRADTLSRETQHTLRPFYAHDIHETGIDIVWSALWKSALTLAVIIMLPIGVVERTLDLRPHAMLLALAAYLIFWVWLFATAEHTANDIVDDAKVAAKLLPSKGARAYNGPKKRSRAYLAKHYGTQNLNLAMKTYADAQRQCPELFPEDDQMLEPFCTWFLATLAAVRRAIFFTSNRRNLSQLLQMFGPLLTAAIKEDPTLLLNECVNVTFDNKKSVTVTL